MEKVEIIQTGNQAMRAGRGLTRVIRRETSQQQRYYLLVAALLIVIGAIVFYAVQPEPEAPEGQIEGHLTHVAPPPDVRVEIQLMEPADLGLLEWQDQPGTMLTRLRFHTTQNPGRFGEATLWRRAADRLWEPMPVRLGNAVTVEDREYTVMRIDSLMVLVSDADGMLHRVFNPRNWPAIRDTYRFWDPPFPADLLLIAEHGFWTLRTGTRRVMGVELLGADGRPVPDAVFARYVDGLEALTVRWRTGEVQGKPRDLLREYLTPPTGSPEIIIKPQPDAEAGDDDSDGS